MREAYLIEIVERKAIARLFTSLIKKAHNSQYKNNLNVVPRGKGKLKAINLHKSLVKETVSDILSYWFPYGF